MTSNTAPSAQAGSAASRAALNRAPQAERVEQRIIIGPDGTIVARSGKVEYGQGIRAGFARIVAEELAVPLEQVCVELGETDRVPWDWGTAGSMSTATDGARIRSAAIQARALLLERAAAAFGLPAASLTCAAGQVRAADGRTLAYAALVASEPLTGPVPENAAATAGPAAPLDDTALRIEARAIVTGQARYPADVRLPGMLRGHALRPPQRGAKLASVDDRAARALPGVTAVVRDGDFLGVVAENYVPLYAALKALKAEWHPQQQTTPPEAFHGALRADDGVDAAFAGAALRLSAEYHAPHIAHASICPRAAVADVRADGADLYVATQRPFGLRDEAAALLGLPAERVRVHPQMMSGLYGRGNTEDVSIEALRLSRAVQRPVLVEWSRGEEFRLSPQRAALDARIEAALDDQGQIVAWRYAAQASPAVGGPQAFAPGVAEQTTGRNAEPPYRLGRASIALHVTPGAVPTASFRSLGAALHVFAIESFIDELARASGQDPIAFRLRMTEDARLRGVLTAVRARSRWDAPRPPGHGLGVACVIYHGTYIAQVAEVIVGADRAIQLERVWSAVDAGRIVHPDGARNQIEGGVQQAASWTLLEELQIRDGQVLSAAWRDYPIATFRDAPRQIDTVFVGDPSAASTGIGEPGVVPTAAAIANAVHAACGVRIRRLPLIKELARIRATQ